MTLLRRSNFEKNTASVPDMLSYILLNFTTGSSIFFKSSLSINSKLHSIQWVAAAPCCPILITASVKLLQTQTISLKYLSSNVKKCDNLQCKEYQNTFIFFWWNYVLTNDGPVKNSL